MSRGGDPMTVPETASVPGAAAELEWLRKGRGRGGAALPVHETLGLRVRDAAPGRCVTRMPTSPAVLGADRRMLAGALGIVADACCGVAASTGLPLTAAVLSAQLRLEFAGPMPVPPNWVEGRATLAAVDNGAALARADLVDDRDDLLAICTLRSLATTWRDPSTVLPSTVLPQTVLPQTAVPAQSPSRARFTGPRHLLGVTSATRGDGRARLELRPSRAVANSFGAVHGGVLAMLAHLTVEDAVATMLGPEEEMVPLDLLVSYLRGVPAGADPVTSTVELSHRGRRFVVAEGQITLHDGRGAVRFSAASQIRPASRP